ncbi:uncharacterized protein EI97DRAFT_313886 [Westerdykella ornata]|uniref:Uncharacterized protein n=1 Tax=Westerdykella ornata TaxID=318751 RepID=A0A6A6JLW4_WESOR|nr:uncharacterized protein EI97DRAFT_313886 [Westerdykella ornata]KAF2277225.1 hypothetical protein EI97DRAFT_313886 [Westerdykella ornata]
MDLCDSSGFKGYPRGRLKSGFFSGRPVCLAVSLTAKTPGKQATSLLPTVAANWVSFSPPLTYCHQTQEPCHVVVCLGLFLSSCGWAVLYPPIVPLAGRPLVLDALPHALPTTILVYPLSPGFWLHGRRCVCEPVDRFTVTVSLHHLEASLVPWTPGTNP